MTESKQIILNTMKPFLDEHGFQEKDGAFTNEKISCKVEYSENRQQYLLFIAPVNVEMVGEYEEKSAWLFDSSHGESDAKSIADDFCETLRGALGMRVSFTRPEDISLPSKGKPGSTPGIEAFTQRFLTLFPQFKEEYKAGVAEYGEFLYDRFYSEKAAPFLRELLRTDNKKQIVKMFAMLEDFYANADIVVTSTISFSLLAPAMGEDAALWETAEKYLEESPVLRQNCVSVRRYLQTHKNRERLQFWKKKQAED